MDLEWGGVEGREVGRKEGRKDGAQRLLFCKSMVSKAQSNSSKQEENNVQGSTQLINSSEVSEGEDEALSIGVYQTLHPPYQLLKAINVAC